MTSNTIISIGCLGIMRCYLNVPLLDAVCRWMKSEDTEQAPEPGMVKFAWVTDEWKSYDGAW